MSRRAIRIVVSCSGVLVCVPAFAQVTQRVSLDTGAVQGNWDSEPGVISAAGGVVAFTSRASNLVPGDTNAEWDLFVRDLRTGVTERVSVASDGTEAAGESGIGSISADGRFVAFWSRAANLVAGDTNGAVDVLVRDRLAGTTERVSLATGGAQAMGDSYTGSISADGRFVVFQSIAANLISGDSNGTWDVFVHDRQSGATERISLDSTGAQAHGASTVPSISADGRCVAFWSLATNLVPGDTNHSVDAFVRDLTSGTTERVSVATGGAQGSGPQNGPGAIAISADGRFVAFSTVADDLVPGDTNGLDDVFVHDRASHTTERVSVDSSGVQGNSNSEHPSLSANGRYVTFMSLSTNLVPGDTTGYSDVFVRDRASGATERVSINSTRVAGNGASFSGADSISADGRWVAFSSGATNLVSGDSNTYADVFVYDRDATGFTSLCDPGVAGVLPCPCSNPAAGAGRGCNNSSGTGGASLSVSGAAYLSIDSLVFTTSGEPPAAMSILVQGSSLHAPGFVYGQGVRCVSGALERLYVKTAQSGGITAPDFVVADPYIVERSAQLGDPIRAGQTRWYFVYYRDPIVLGGCPSTSTFNATQSGQVSWSL